MSGYELSRQWFDFVYESPSKVSGNHTALYMWLCEIYNRMSWPAEFSITSTECMAGMSCKSYNTYKKCLDDLIEWGFVRVVERAKNQWQTNIIALSKNDNPLYKAVDKAVMKHATEHSTEQCCSTIQSTCDIHKPQTINHKPQTINEPEPVQLPFNGVFEGAWKEWINYRKQAKIKPYTPLGLQKALTKLVAESGNDQTTAVAMIEESIANGWQGIFPLKNKAPTKNNPPAPVFVQPKTTTNWD